MASQTYNLNTWASKRIIGDDSAASWSGALLHTGAGRSSNAATGDTWLFADDNGTALAPYGIKHDTVDNKIVLIGNNTTGCWVTLDTGDTYILGKVGIGYDPDTSGNTYKLYIDGGTSYFDDNVYVNGAMGVGYDPDTSGNTYKLYVSGTSYFDNTVYFNDGSTYYIDSNGSANLHGLTTDDTATFNGTIRINNEEDRGRIFVRGTSNTKDMGYFGFSRSDPGDGDLYYNTSFLVLNYSYNSSTKARLDRYEYFDLPAVSADLEQNVHYNILTTKNLSFSITGTAANVTGTVAIANGGTGATTYTDARDNLHVCRWFKSETDVLSQVKANANNGDEAVFFSVDGSTYSGAPGTANWYDIISCTPTTVGNAVTLLAKEYGSNHNLYVGYTWRNGTSQPTWKQVALGDGTGASGSWGISITGNAATATKATNDGDDNTITSYYCTLSTDQTITGSKKFTKAVQCYRYTSNNNLPAITMDKPGSHYVGIGADGTSNRIKFGPCAGLDGSAWKTISEFNSNEWYFQGAITSTASITGGQYTANTAQSSEYQIMCCGGAGKIYMYSQAATNGSRGLYGCNAAGTNVSILTVNSSNGVTLNGSSTTVGNYFRYQRVIAMPSVATPATGWRRVCKVGANINYPYFFIGLNGGFNSGAPANILIVCHTRHTGATLTQLSGITGNISKIRLVNVSGGVFWVDAYINGLSSGTMGDQTLEFMGNVTISEIQNSSAVYSTSVTAAAEITLIDISGTNVTSSNIGSQTVAACTGNAAGLSGGLVTNTVTSHGNLAVTTAKGSYYGINFGHNTSGMSIMSINASHQGLYNQANGQWIVYYNAASTSKSISLGSSTVNVTGGISLNANTKVTGTFAVSSTSLLGGTLAVVNNTQNDGTYDALLYIEHKSANDWGILVNKNSASDYGISVKCTSTGSHGIDVVGRITGTKVYGAVWNDYAECRNVNTEIAPGYVVYETESGTMEIANKRLQAGCKIVSDTYGMCIGETEEAKTPIAVCGRVLVYPYRDRNEYELGAALCSAPNGTVDIMTREEIIQYPERIIGTVSEIPNYETWLAGERDGNHIINVNGRIWIYVR